MTLQIDIARGVALAKVMGQSTEFQYMFDGDLNTVEFMLHEIGHALSLGIDTDPALWAKDSACKKDRIDHAISVALGSPGVVATWEEAVVLAAESILFRRLGYPVDRYALAETAWIQGVSDDELASALRSPAAADLAERMLDWAQVHGIVKEAA
jgi:hypothetical protein